MSGVFGFFAPDGGGAAETAYFGLYALQHRGQESAGLAVSDGRRIRIRKGMGLVTQVLTDEAVANMPGSISIGHVRYSKAGEPHVANAQPLLGFTQHGQLALAHDGKLTNAPSLRQRLQRDGAVLQTTTDSELILNLIARQTGDPFEEAVVKAIGALRGAFSVVLMTNDKLIGFRDYAGIRPLSIGRHGEATILASESAAFDTIGADRVRDVEPGELVVVDAQGLRTRQLQPAQAAFCVFEYIYFARPDSHLAERNVHLIRKAIGRQLARESRIAADLVIPAPDSGTSAALGYAEESGIPFDFGLMKNRYVGRTFIQPTPALRQKGVRIKLNPVSALLKDQRVIVVDDSIVRGTTSGKTVEMLKDAGAREVHMAIASPPFIHACHYGIDIANTDDLIAAHRTQEEVRKIIGADSLHYLSLSGLYKALQMPGTGLCTACFTGEYPLGVGEPQSTSDLLEDEE
ncbi:MAG: amidophosphoribosyltransferase [Firmicutes bacterium]|jgi:amidophosphoribosyltransferase|nr:amidophosphoribosyltransferase [Bacillota bacterium]